MTATSSTSTSADTSAFRNNKSTLMQSRIKTAWLFLTPMLVVLMFVAGWPLVRTIWLSMTDANLSDLSHTTFIGWENYLSYIDYGEGDGEWVGVLADRKWWRAVWNTLYFALISVSVETVLGLLIALLLNAPFRGRGWVRAAMLIPWAIPTIVSAKLWGWMFHDQYGVINDLLLHLGLISKPLAWTASNHLAMTAVIIADVWKTTPFMALLILAALQMLPNDCYEAARVDGIHPVRVFFKVTLPLIKPALMV
ncbi:MAG: sugar ABC transporter permease, partial [Gammaproteobacteria bacterium]